MMSNPRTRFGGTGVALATLVCLAIAPAVLGAARKTEVTRTAARDPYVGAIALDAITGRVLFEDQADAKGYPASVLKLMDLLIILEKVERHELTLRDPVPASAKACEAGPSKVWLAERERFPLDEMLYALMVQSANDVAVALAEKVGGSTDGFLQLMNQRARDLGMTNSEFHSVNGLPPKRGQAHDVTTARDLSRLCLEVLRHPDTLRYTCTRQRIFRANVPGKAVEMRNHNHLLGELPGCDGLKTGWIASAGYSIAITAARDGHRVVVVVLGSANIHARDAKAAELANRALAALSAGAPRAAGSSLPAARPAGRK